MSVSKSVFCAVGVFLWSSNDLSASSAAPSFDCTKANTSTELAICKDEQLATLDAAIARIYAQVQSKLDTSAAKALREDQRKFLEARDGALREDLEDRLRNRLSFLESALATPLRDSFAGTWENAWGIITIKTITGQEFTVDAEASDPISARWVCSVDGEAYLMNGALVFTYTDNNGKPSVTIRLRLKEKLLSEETKNNDLQREYCGANGFLDGTFFRTGS